MCSVGDRGQRWHHGLVHAAAFRGTLLFDRAGAAGLDAADLGEDIGSGGGVATTLYCLPGGTQYV